MVDSSGYSIKGNLPTIEKTILECASSILQNGKIGIVIFNSTADILFTNETFQQWIGFIPSDNVETQVIAQKLTPIIQLFTERNQTLHQLEIANLEIHRKGMHHPLTIQGVVFGLHTHKINRQFCMIGWLNSLLDSEVSNARQIALANLVSSVPIGVISINQNWECEFVNNEFCILTERTEQQLLGRGWTQVFENNNERLQELVQSLLDESVARCEISLTLPGKSTCTLELDIRAYIDQQGKLTHAVGALIDVSERVERQNHIHRLANFDPITGLHNRLSMQHQLERYIDVAQKLFQKVQLMFIDLDGFKTVNDLYGHPVGDELLKQVADRISATIRSSDVVARVGGDEFVILIPGDVNEDVVNSIAHKLISKLSQKYNVNDLKIHITSSIGIACFTGDEESISLSSHEVVDKLMKEADIALYAAKQQGKNNFKRYDQSHSDRVTSIFKISQKLPEAITKNRFYMNYQPIIDCKTNKTIAIEALIRWNDDELGEVRPDVFVNFAESHGKILELQDCMIRKVSQDIKNLYSSNLQVPPVTVNLSGIQLTESESLFDFLGILNDYELRNKDITLEITESVLIEDHKNVLPHLIKIKDLGFNLALDDFGTGYSSLSYLTKFPIDYIKLDKFFVDTIEDDEQQLNLVAGVIALSHSLGKKVVAEGIESQQQLELLNKVNCNFAQGYFISRPIPLSSLVQWINDERKNHK